MSKDPSRPGRVSDEPHYEVDPDLALSEQAEAPRVRVAKRRGPSQPVLLAVIAAGGAIGGSARYLVAQELHPPPGTFPWPTWIVNVTGCFLIGILMVVVVDLIPGQRYVRPFLGVGILGGYTTFSTFMVDTDKLIYDQRVDLAAWYVTTSIVVGLLGVYLGLVVGRLAVRVAPAVRALRARGRSRAEGGSDEGRSAEGRPVEGASKEARR